MFPRLTQRLPWRGVVVTRLTCQENMTLSPFGWISSRCQVFRTFDPSQGQVYLRATKNATIVPHLAAHLPNILAEEKEC